MNRSVLLVGGVIAWVFFLAIVSFANTPPEVHLPSRQSRESEMAERPIIDRVLQASSDPSSQTVTLFLGVDERNGFEVELKHSVVGVLTAALVAESLKLTAHLPDGVSQESATLNTSAVWLSQSPDGKPMLVFELVGGSLLPLVMGSGDFAGLAAEMALLAAQPQGPAN